MIYYVTGNLLDTHCQYICHQVNCQGAMNSGVAKAIREKWPIVYHDYKIKCNYAEDIVMNNKANPCATPANYLLGNIQIVALYQDYETSTKHPCVINMFAQNGYGYDGKRYTSYDGFWMCLGSILDYVPKGSTIAFPDHIGCCRGGANWNVIKTMIEEVLGNDYEVYIYKLEEEIND